MQKNLVTRAIRGAITVEENKGEQISSATLELLKSMLNQNEINNEDIVSVVFTLTDDLNAEFPAKTARIDLGWNEVPMMCASEIPVPGSIEKCIRVMITFNSFKAQNELKHVYLRDAQRLRPDLV